jgi:hypothetical protein
VLTGSIVLEDIGVLVQVKHLMLLQSDDQGYPYLALIMELFHQTHSSYDNNQAVE